MSTTASTMIRWCGALAMAAMAGTACGQSAVITFENNAVGGLHGQDGPGGPWLWAQPTERLDLQVVSDRVSPIGGGARAVKYPAGLGSTRISVDLGAVFNSASGVVKIQYDIWHSSSFGQGSLRLIPIIDDVTQDGAAAQDVVGRSVGQLYLTGAGGQYNMGIWTSVGAGAPGFNDNIITRVASAGACEGKWYRVAYYFDLDQQTAPMVYGEMFDIDSGTAVRVGEFRGGDIALRLNNSAVEKAIRGLTIRAPGSQNEEFYLDNIRVESVPGFSMPQPPIPLTDPGDPSPLPRPDLRAEVTETASMEVDLGDTIGDMPSISLVGDTLWMLDGGFGLQSWDTSARPSEATFVDGALGIEFAANPASIMVPSGDGSKLYVWANTLGLGSLNTANWRDLAAYDIGSGAWSLLIDGDVVTGTGDSGIARAVVNGQELVYSAWLGASQYTGFNVTRASSAASITGVGNRWAGALTEGRSADELFMLAHTDAAGNRLNGLTGQVHQGLYRSTWAAGCVNSTAILRRISPSAQVVPWTLACNDGGCVNRASLEYVPATNCIWVTRAANTNDIGVYDLDTDSWGVVKVNRPDGSPLAMENVDLQLVGDRMYIYSQNETAVYSINALVDGEASCAVDFDGDGFVDFFDFSAYVDCFEGGACPPGKSADFDGDGFVDFFDFSAFVEAFETGC